MGLTVISQVYSLAPQRKLLSSIREALPPMPKPGVYGRLLISMTYVKVGDYGIGCESGSEPQPFVVASLDEKEQMIGLIYPYMTCADIDEESVTLQVNGDTHDPEVATVETLYHVRQFKYNELIGKY